MSDMDDIRRLLSEPTPGLTPEMVEGAMEMVEAHERADAFRAEHTPMFEALVSAVVLQARKKFGHEFVIADGEPREGDEHLDYRLERGGVSIGLSFWARPRSRLCLTE